MTPEILQLIAYVGLSIAAVLFAAGWLFLPFMLSRKLDRAIARLEQIEANTRSAAAPAAPRTTRSDIDL